MFGEKCNIFSYHKSLKYIFYYKKLNLKQRPWMELIKDYDCIIIYHPGNANVVANLLSRKGSNRESKGRMPFLRELKSYTTSSNGGTVGNLIAQFQVKPMLEEKVVKVQP